MNPTALQPTGISPLLMKEMAELTEANPDTLTARSSARSPRAVECALALAAGVIPDVGWAIVVDLNVSYLMIGFDPVAKPLAFCFGPQHTDFLVAIAKADYFTLQTEGCIPVRIPIRRHDDALRPWLRARGYAV